MEEKQTLNLKRMGQKFKLPCCGYTLVELLIAIATLTLILSIAVPSLRQYIEKAKVNRAVSEIRALEKEIMIYDMSNGGLPGALSDIGRDDFPDPWGSPYEYLKIDTGSGKGKGKTVGAARKDQFLVPLNSDFDLYSKGRDGDSVPPLNAQKSWDDVVRAVDGKFVGLASEF